MTTITPPVRIEMDHPATFGCSMDLAHPYRWQWMRNGKILGGSHNAASYQTPPLVPGDLGAKYSVTVFGMDGSVETSEEVTLGSAPVKPKSKEKDHGLANL